MPPVCPLAEANASRRRAWRELQSIRKMLALVLDHLPPPPKPPDFQAEGAILRAALVRALREPWGRLAKLEEAVRGVRPYVSNTLQDGKFPLAVLALNQAVDKPRPPVEKLLEK